VPALPGRDSGESGADARTEDGKLLWRAASPGAVPAADLAGVPASELAAVPAADWAGMQPVRLPFDQAEALYAGYRAWAEMVARPEFALRLRLAPGDCLVFDNTRILHARTAFSSSPAREGAPAQRHLQGCYADLDGLLSTLAVLRRDRDGRLG
jgi:hypothetical protein